MTRVIWVMAVVSPQELMANLGAVCRVRIEEDKLTEAHAYVKGRIDLLNNYFVNPQAAEAITPIAHKWACGGFQTIEIGHKLAASLMSTSMAPEVCINLLLPWQSFAMLVPAGLLSTRNDFVWVNRDFQGIHVTRWCEEGWYYGYEPTMVHWNTRNWISYNASSMTENERVIELVARLLIGVCAEFTGYAPSAITANSKSSHRTLRNRKLNVFKLTRPVKFDTREAVRSYVRGGGIKPTVQTLVRGHWKMQPTGMRRKLIQIEPYWRGPEEAPVAVRVHEWSGE